MFLAKCFNNKHYMEKDVSMYQCNKKIQDNELPNLSIANLFVAFCLCNISQCTKKRLSSALFLIGKWSFRCHGTCGANGANWPELKVPGQRLLQVEVPKGCTPHLKILQVNLKLQVVCCIGNETYEITWHGIWYVVPPPRPNSLRGPQHQTHCFS